MKMLIHESLTSEAGDELSKLLRQLAVQSTEGVFVVDPKGGVLAKYCSDAIANSPLISVAIEIFNRTSLAMAQSSQSDVQQIILYSEAGRIVIASCGSAGVGYARPGPAILVRVERMDMPRPCH